MAQRNMPVDVARGALILYIISIVHGFFWLNLVPVAIGAIFLFEMPLIFIVSGYAYRLYEQETTRDETKNVRSYLSYIFSRWSRILVPYFVYAIFCIILCIAYAIFKKTDWPIYEIVLSWLNPFDGGKGYTFGMLNWHLWFIPPFLIVTALLPWVSKIKLKLKFRLPLWTCALLVCIIVYLLPLFGETLQFGLFYLIWAFFGYNLARLKFSLQDYRATLSALIITFLSLIVIFPDTTTLNMQVNKFPPNSIFYLFSATWVCLILMTVKYIPFDFLIKLDKQIWFRPFIKAGYSIFLWQGLGYTIASMGGKLVGLPAILVWPVAIIASICFGMAAAPAERIRIKKRLV